MVGPAVDDEASVASDAYVLGVEVVDRCAAEQEQALDGCVPEELLPRLLPMSARRCDEIDVAEVRVVDPA